MSSNNPIVAPIGYLQALISLPLCSYQQLATAGRYEKIVSVCKKFALEHAHLSHSYWSNQYTEVHHNTPQELCNN